MTELYDYMEDETLESEKSRYTESANGPRRAEIWENRKYNSADRDVFRVMENRETVELPKLVITRKPEQKAVRAKKHSAKRIIKKLHRSEVFGMIAGVSAMGYALCLLNSLYTLGIAAAVCLWFAFAGIILSGDK